MNLQMFPKRKLQCPPTLFDWQVASRKCRAGPFYNNRFMSSYLLFKCGVTNVASPVASHRLTCDSVANAAFSRWPSRIVFAANLQPMVPMSAAAVIKLAKVKSLHVPQTERQEKRKKKVVQMFVQRLLICT